MSSQTGCVSLAGFASLAALSIGSVAQAATVACTPATFEGAPVCEVDMSQYAVSSSGSSVCPSATVTYSGTAPICLETFKLAVADAKSYLNAHTTSTYLINIDAGSYDYSGESAPLSGLNGAIDVSGVLPNGVGTSGTGCLTNTGTITGTLALSGSGCLLFSGAVNATTGAPATTLTSPSGVAEIFGNGKTSHIMVQNINWIQPNSTAALINAGATEAASTQGTVVTAAQCGSCTGSTTIGSKSYPFFTIDVPAGFLTPLDQFNAACNRAGPSGSGTSTCGSLTNVNLANVGLIYARAYTTTYAPNPNPGPVQSSSSTYTNQQFAFDFPGGNVAVAPSQPYPTTHPTWWKVTMDSSGAAAAAAVTTYYAASTAGVPNLVCMKEDSGSSFYFSDLGSGGVPQGTDIVMNNINWYGGTRGVFHGITGNMSGTILGAQVYNSSLQPNPVSGQTPCLSQGGGLQLGNTTDMPIWGNVYYNVTISNTGDDSIAIFNDVGGTLAPGGGTYPQSYVLQSKVVNSFVRDFNLYNDPVYSGYTGNSPVSVDSASQSYTTLYGNCDPLVIQSGCPVTYTGP